MIFQFIEVEEDIGRNAISSAIDTSSQNLEGASLRKNLFKFLDYDPRAELREINGKAHHNALDDAIIQACAVQKCYKLLKTVDLAITDR